MEQQQQQHEPGASRKRQRGADDDDDAAAKRRRRDSMPAFAEYNANELETYKLEPGVDPLDTDLLRALLAFAVETIGNSRTSIRARDVGPPRYATRVVTLGSSGGAGTGAAAASATLAGPPLYYDVTVSYEPAVVIKYEHLQGLMDQSVGRVTNVYTRIDPTAVRQELGFRFYTMTRPPPQQFDEINFTNVRRRYGATGPSPLPLPTAHHDQQRGSGGGITGMIASLFRRNSEPPPYDG